MGSTGLCCTWAVSRRHGCLNVSENRHLDIQNKSCERKCQCALCSVSGVTSLMCMLVRCPAKRTDTILVFWSHMDVWMDGKRTWLNSEQAEYQLCILKLTQGSQWAAWTAVFIFHCILSSIERFLLNPNQWLGCDVPGFKSDAQSATSSTYCFLIALGFKNVL